MSGKSQLSNYKREIPPFSRIKQRRISSPQGVKMKRIEKILEEFAPLIEKIQNEQDDDKLESLWKKFDKLCKKYEGDTYNDYMYILDYKQDNIWIDLENGWDQPINIETTFNDGWLTIEEAQAKIKRLTWLLEEI